MNNEIKEKLKFKIAISEIKEEEKAMNNKEKFIFKNLGIYFIITQNQLKI